MSRLQAFLNRSIGRPIGRCLEASSPYRIKVFGDASIIHAAHMSKPTQTTLTEHKVHAEGTCCRQHFDVCDLVLPGNAQDPMKTAEVEVFQAVLLSGVCGPELTAIQQSTQDACLVHLEFGVSPTLALTYVQK